MRAFETTTDAMRHQLAAADKISPSRVGALFMEVGTGKSRTGIELVRRRHDKIDKAVWFCPVSLKETVRREIIKHTDCQDINVFDDRTTEDNIPDSRWHVIGIESISSSARVVCAANKLITEHSHIILDESDMIKTHNALRTQRITMMSERAKYRLAMTGLEISNGIVDLFAQMKFLSPKILGYNSFYSFAANHLEYSDKFPGMIVRAHNTEYLAAKMQPYVYQVLKDECLDLPPKIYESTYYFSMTEEQRDWYNRVKDEYLDIDPYDFNGTVIFSLFTKLQEVVSGYYKRQSHGCEEIITFPHKRIDYLVEAIRRIPVDKQIVVWAKYIYDIKGIAARLREEYGEDAVSVYHGDLSIKQRNREEAKFTDGISRIIVISLGCGSRGLNGLVKSSHSLHYNNSLKLFQRFQAEGRVHRKGQMCPVVYRDIHCYNSIDDRISKSLSKKQSIVTAFREEIEKVKDKKTQFKELIMAL